MAKSEATKSIQVYEKTPSESTRSINDVQSEQRIKSYIYNILSNEI